MEWKFWNKKKTIIDDGLESLINYIEEARRNGFSDKDILIKFYEKKYPQEIIDAVFKKIQGGMKMAKKEKEEFDDDEDTEEVEDTDEDDEEEETPKVKKKVIQEEKEEPKKLTSEQIQGILTNHEQRLQSIEGTLYRHSL